LHFSFANNSKGLQLLAQCILMLQVFTTVSKHILEPMFALIFSKKDVIDTDHNVCNVKKTNFETKKQMTNQEATNVIVKDFRGSFERHVIVDGTGSAADSHVQRWQTNEQTCRASFSVLMCLLD